LSTVEPGIGIVAGSIATLRPLVRHIWGRLSLSDATPEVRSRTYYPSDSNRRRKYRHGHRRSLSPSYLIPTELGDVTSTPIEGSHDADLESQSPQSNAVVVGIDVPKAKFVPMTAIQYPFEEPPKLHLRESLRHSFTKDIILSPSKYLLHG